MSPTSGARSKTSSLLVTLPIVLGTRLPEEIREALAQPHRAAPHRVGSRDTAARHRRSTRTTAIGAGRSGRHPLPSSKTAFASAGFVELADRVSERFLGLCERSGFAENFDAISGDGLRDRAYTWTASTYLLFAG